VHGIGQGLPEHRFRFKPAPLLAPSTRKDTA